MPALPTFFLFRITIIGCDPVLLTAYPAHTSDRSFTISTICLYGDIAL